jgi:hypothetical protein
MLLDGDVFILQVRGVITHIRSGATLATDYDDVYRSNLLCSGGDKGAEGHKCGCV